MATFDYVYAYLTCPACGETAKEPWEIDLQTRVRAQPEGRGLIMGDRVILVEDLTQRGYLQVGKPPRRGVLRVLEPWTCPSCGKTPVWARLTFEDGVLADVKAADLSPASLAEAEYISPAVLALVPPDQAPQVRSLSPDALRDRLARLQAVL
jgi:hypothetical protein